MTCYMRSTKKKTGPKKNGGCWLARINRPLYFEKNGRRSRAAIINRSARSVFSGRPHNSFSSFLVGGTSLMKSCYAGGGPGLARQGKVLAEITATESTKRPEPEGCNHRKGLNKNRKTRRLRGHESSIRDFDVW